MQARFGSIEGKQSLSLWRAEHGDSRKSAWREGRWTGTKESCPLWFLGSGRQSFLTMYVLHDSVICCSRHHEWKKWVWYCSNFSSLQPLYHSESVYWTRISHLLYKWCVVYYVPLCTPAYFHASPVSSLHTKGTGRGQTPRLIARRFVPFSCVPALAWSDLSPSCARLPCSNLETTPSVVSCAREKQHAWSLWLQQSFSWLSFSLRNDVVFLLLRSTTIQEQSPLYIIYGQCNKYQWKHCGGWNVECARKRQTTTKTLLCFEYLTFRLS
jgi:hypothetical protein